MPQGKRDASAQVVPQLADQRKKRLTLEVPRKSEQRDRSHHFPAGVVDRRRKRVHIRLKRAAVEADSRPPGLAHAPQHIGPVLETPHLGRRSIQNAMHLVVWAGAEKHRPTRTDSQ